MVRTWWLLGDKKRGRLPGRDVMGVGIDFMSGIGDPNGVRRAMIGSHYTDRSTSTVWVNLDGAFTWNCLTPCVA